MADIIEVAKAAYAAYGDSTCNKNFRGEEMPTWDALPQSIQDAWVAACTTVLRFA